jgi:hypothetical protein
MIIDENDLIFCFLHLQHLILDLLDNMGDRQGGVIAGNDK